MRATEHQRFVFLRLEHCLQHLAMPPESQLQLLPDFVCKADELALSFDHWREVAANNYGFQLTPSQAAALSAIDNAFVLFSDSNPEHWTDEAVRSSAEWQEIRRLAAEALSVFEWQHEMPPSYAHEFVKATAFPFVKRE
jgi:hypothetical protein